MKACKSTKELKKDYDNAVNELKLAVSEIADRLYDLALKNPEAPITTTVMGSPVNKAKSLISKFYISNLPIQTQFYFIEIIEKFAEESSGIKQLKIEFNN
jgi:hypothetical protein